MALPGRIRVLMNRGLGAVGLKISTTRAERAEDLRLRALAARGHWSTPHFAAGLQFDDEKYLRFLEEVCLPYRQQCCTWPRTQTGSSNGFYLDNGWFGSVDAEVLYSVSRWYRPRTVVEVGSGFSTRLIRRAISEGDLPTRLHCIDPAPRIDIDEYADEHIQERVEELDSSELARSLGANDILFIDSSHNVIVGGDVPFLFLEVLPRLAPEVLIHVHDIFLPFDYPREWMVHCKWNWNEQYLVNALLYANSAFEILWPAHYMWRRYPQELRQIIPSEPSGFGPSSLWLRKLA